MKRLLRLVLIVGTVVVALYIAQTVLVSRQREALEARAARVLDETVARIDTLRVTVGATGTVLPARQSALAFEQTGIVREVAVEIGEWVPAGTVLARLDTTDLDILVENALVALELQRIAFDALTAPAREEDIAVARAAVASAQASVNAALSTGVTPQQAEIARLQSELARNQLWQAQLQRDLALSQPAAGPGFDVGALIPEDVDVPPELVNQVNAALAGLLPSFPSGAPSADSFTAGLNQAEFGVAIADANAAAVAGRTANQGSVASANAALVAAQAQLDRLVNGASDIEIELAELNLMRAELAVRQAEAARDRARIVAPFDGVVAQVNLVEGQPPPSGSPAFVFIDNSRFYVDLSIDEIDIVEVETGQLVNFNLDALPDERVTGRVERVAIAPIVAGQLVTYPVRVALDPTDAPLRVGMSATATIIVDEIDEALVLPNRFIRIDRATGRAFVNVERSPGRFTEVGVELGLRGDFESQILSGLQAGDRVVLLPRGTFDPFTGSPGGP